MIEQAQVKGERRNLPYRIQGQIAVPAGSGRHPLVVVIHGSHAACPAQAGGGDLEIDTWPCLAEQEQRNDRGWRYLLEDLARQGYVAMAPNMNAIHTLAWGGMGSTYERFAAVLNAHLDRLAAADQAAEKGFGIDLAGRIDLGRTALVGHSQGGGYVMAYAAERASAAGGPRGGPLAGALLVAPAFQRAAPESAGAEALAPDLPLGIVMGLCDGDVANLEGLIYYAAARAQERRANAVQIVMPYGANHNYFNSILGPDGLDPLGAPGCDRPAGRQAPAQQQAFLAAYAGDFFAGVFAGAAPPAAWQAGAPAPQRLYDTPALTALLAPTAQRQPLLTLAGDKLPDDPAGAVVTATAPLTIDVCGVRSETCRTGDYAIPSFEVVDQPALRLSWQGRGGELRLALPQARRDLSPFVAIQLRVALDAYESAQSGPQALRFELRDAAGGRATVTVPAETLALQPPSAELRDANQPQPYLRGLAPLAAVRIPLSEFAGVDLTRIESLALVFDQSERGALFVTDLELLR
jgi:dienelactone hydrolase